MAEVYSTLRPQGGKVLVGSIPEGRLLQALLGQWVPIDQVLAAGQDSALYNEKNKAGSFYSEAWALSHMLNLDKDYRTHFTEMRKEMIAGASAADAFQKVYGKTLKEVDRDLQAYLRRNQFQGVLFDVKMQRTAEIADPVPADDYDVRLSLLELKPDFRDPATGKGFEELIATQPQRPDAYASLGYWEWAAGRPDAAESHFGKAYELGVRDPRMLWDLGRLAEGRDRALAGRVFGDLVAQQPERIDVRLQLGQVRMMQNDASAALAAVTPIHKVTPADAPALFRILAFANLKLGNMEAARDNAERLKQTAVSESDRREAERLLSYLKASKTPPAEMVQPDVESTGRPTLSHRDQVVPETAPVAPQAAPARPSAHGLFVELRCAGANATLILRTSAGESKKFYLDKPDQVTIESAAGNRMDFACGPQKPKEVTVEFDPAPAGIAADGLLRVLRGMIRL
jgi:hypothetical protein